MAGAELALRPFPRLTDVRSLLQLSPEVEDLEDPAAPDRVDADGKVWYRFFRDAERVPFVVAGAPYQALDAWYLSDASLLAYASRPLPSAAGGAVRRVEAALEAQVTPPLRRLFAALARRDGPGPDPLQVKAIVRASPLEHLAPFSSPVQCLVADDGRVGLVVFRGTLLSSLASWMGDLDADLAPLPDGPAPAGDPPRVHDGFRRAAELLLADFSSGGERDPGLRGHLTARRSARPGLRVWCAGHSLGGALATLCASALARAPGGVEALYTYGSPRVGDVRFAERFAAAGIPYYRVVHHHDVVPHLPPSLPPLFPYEHVGTLEYLEYADERTLRSGEPRPILARRLESPARGAGGTLSSVVRWIREEAGRVRLGPLRAALEPLLDHAPLYYSNLLWNAFVQEVGDPVRPE